MVLFKRNKLTIQLQHEKSECGLTCICMILNYYGIDIDIFNLRQNLVPTSSSGLTIKDMASLGRHYGLIPSAVSLDATEIKELSLPCILHWEGNHYVVLTQISSKTVTIADPAQGLRKISYDLFTKSFTHAALELQKPLDFIKPPIPKKKKIRWLAFIAPISNKIAVVFILSLITEFISLTMPAMFQFSIDNISTYPDFSFIVSIMASLALLILLQSGTESLQKWISATASIDLEKHISSSLINKFFNLDMMFFKSRDIGNILNSLNSPSKIQDLIISKSVKFFIDLVSIFSILILLFYYGGFIFILPAVTSIFDLSIRLLFFYKYKLISCQQITITSRLQSQLIETIRAIATIRMQGLALSRFLLWKKNILENFSCKLEQQRLDIINKTINDVLFGIEGISIIVYGAFMVSRGSISIGVLVAIISYKDQFTRRFSNIVDYILQYKMAKIQIDRFSDVMHSNEEHNSVGKDIINNDNSDKCILHCHNLSYSFPGSSNFLFKDINFKLIHGESLAIIGPSGSGKTTLINILMGLQAPTRGQVIFNGTKIHKTPIEDYRDNVAAVIQNDDLFSGTILENISGFSPNPDLDTVHDSLARACILDEINYLPLGIMTKISPNMPILSAGQKQRIMLARALYRQRKLLFLDEATCNLDLDLEEKVLENIMELPLSIISVSHRRSFYTKMTKIIIFQKNGSWKLVSKK